MFLALISGVRGGGRDRERDDDRDQQRERDDEEDRRAGRICPICLERQRIPVRCGQCKKSFCSECLYEYFQKTQLCICPLCRSDRKGKDEVCDLALRHYRSDYLILDAAEKGNEALVHILLKDGADPNITNEGRETPCHVAARGGNAGVIQVLLADARTDPNMVNYNDETPISLAAANERNYEEHTMAGVVKAFLASDRTDPNIPNALFETPISVAAKKGNEEVVKALLASDRTDPNKTDEEELDGNTPIHLAAEEGHWSVVEALLADRRTDPNKVNGNGETPCDRAVRELEVLIGRQGDKPWLQAPYKEVIELLRKHGAKCD